MSTNSNPPNDKIGGNSNSTSKQYAKNSNPHQKKGRKPNRSKVSGREINGEKIETSHQLEVPSPLGQGGERKNGKPVNNGRWNNTDSSINDVKNERPKNRRSYHSNSRRAKDNKNHEPRNHTGRHERKQRTRRSSPPIQIVTCDFVSSMHRKIRAARYNVHRPGCNCSKVKDVLAKIKPPQTVSNEGNGTDAIGTRNQTRNSSNTNTSHSSEMLDGLVVLPDIRQPLLVYLCDGTDRVTFESDPTAAELKLRKELFSSSSPPRETNDTNDHEGNISNHNVHSDNIEASAATTTAVASLPPFKVKCAACMLKREPNGMICVQSTSLTSIEMIRDMARTKAKEISAEGKPLHADHAHFVCALSRKSLWNITRARTKSQETEAVSALSNELMLQGVLVNHNEVLNVDNSMYEIGYHLKSVLHITAKDKAEERDSNYYFTIVYDNTNDPKKRSWALDLPGGKRHLGENALEGAIRETEEEASLVINPQHWKMIGDVPRINKKFEENAYFMFHPPPCDDESVKDVIASTSALDLK